MTRRRTSPEASRKITAHAVEHVSCQDCGAGPGQPCTRPGRGRPVHKSRYISAAIELRQALKAAALTLEQRAVLTRLPKIPRSEFAAITTERGGLRASKEWFVEHGLPYPPPAGWRQAVEREDDGDDR